MKNLSIKRSLYCKKRINMLANSAIRVIISGLNTILFILLFVVISVMIYKFHNGVALNDICGLGQESYNYHKALFALLTLWVANVQISRYLTQYTLDSLLDLRDKFDKEHFRKIQQKLIEKDGSMFAFENIELLNFLGYIEIGAVMLQKGVMTNEQFSNQFGYIIELLCDRPEFVKHVSEDRDYYDDLLFAIRLEFPEICNLD